ncbi:hypothetical protein C8J57DRAFT_1466901 [Mycena rebaudengoi]|nr:hypothetical protein C8J57DRAFT_1466901 [Mycena rebaudengoi]
MNLKFFYRGNYQLIETHPRSDIQLQHFSFSISAQVQGGKSVTFRGVQKRENRRTLQHNRDRWRDRILGAVGYLVTSDGAAAWCQSQQTSVPASAFFRPILPGYERLRCPFYAFLVEHTGVTTQRVMFDLGPRKDGENAAPRLAAGFKSGDLAMLVDKDIVEQLVKGGIELNSIDAVIWR